MGQRVPVDTVDGLSLLAISRAIEGRRAEASALALRSRFAARTLGSDDSSEVLADAVLAWAAPSGSRGPSSVESRAELADVITAFVRAGLCGSRGDLAGADEAVQQVGRAAARTGVARAQRTDGTGLVDPLTPKEGEVLALLGELLTTEEIARSMYVSINTVKTHIRGILRKLDVRRRHEAVRRARQLQLIA